MNKPKGGHGSINDLVGTAGLTALFVIGVFFSDTNIVRCAAGLAVLWDLKMSAGLVTVMALLPVFFISNGFSLFLLLQFSFLFDCESSEHRCFFCRLYSYRPSYNVAPGSYMPVLRREKDGVAVHCMKWGLVPGFTKKTDKPDFFKMVKTLLFWFYICLSSLIPVLRYWSYFLQFNARSESIAEKASFRRLLPKNRCLVAVDGYLYYLFYYS